MEPGDELCVMGLTLAATRDGRPQIEQRRLRDHRRRPDLRRGQERLSRRKHQGGAELALTAVLSAVGRTPSKVTRFVVSTCGEPVPAGTDQLVIGARTGLALEHLGVDPARVTWMPSHHLSHALTAVPLLEGEPAAILVIDEAGGARGGAGWSA